jgi:hypothetical protein
MSAAAVVFGSALIYKAYNFYSQEGLNSGFFYNAALGVVCILGAGISRRLFLSDVGIVRETRSWGKVIRRVLPWKDIRHVTLVYRGERMMAFFEIGATGWKAPFTRSQENQILDVIGQMIPDTEIDTL